MTNDNEMQWNEKLDFYLKKEIMVHIDLKDNTFLNAFILEKESDKVYVIKERKFGLMHLFIADIKKLSEFRGEDDGNRFD